MLCKSAATCLSLTRYPVARSASASCWVLLQVQRSGDCGSPRLAGATMASRSLTSSGVLCSRRLRPPPGRRTPPEGVSGQDAAAPARTSRIPAVMVGRDRPVASATCVTPPQPNACASTAAQRLFDRSSTSGESASNFCFSIATVVMNGGKHFPASKSRAFDQLVFSLMLKGQQQLDPGHYDNVHRGYDTTYVKQDPHRLLPVDVARELEQQGT